MSDKTHEIQSARRLSGSTPEISACQNEYSSYTPPMPCRRLFVESEHGYFSEFALDASTSSNFLDLDQLSSSGNSCEESYERSPVANISSENVINGLTSEKIPLLKEIDPEDSDTLQDFSASFVKWVIHGETLSLR